MQKKAEVANKSAKKAPARKPAPKKAAPKKAAPKANERIRAHQDFWIGTEKVIEAGKTYPRQLVADKIIDGLAAQGKLAKV